MKSNLLNILKLRGDFGSIIKGRALFKVCF